MGNRRLAGPTSSRALPRLSALGQHNTRQLERLLEDRFLSDLPTLNLNGFQLIRLPENFDVLRGLQRLHLGHNRLSSLPQSFGQLVALVELWIGSNRLTSLPETFGQLTALEVVLPKCIGIETSSNYFHLE